MAIALAALARIQIKFQIRIPPSNLTQMLKNILRQRRAPKIGVKNHSRRIDDWPERTAERETQLRFNSSCEAAQRQREAARIEPLRKNFGAQPGHDCPHRLSHCVRAISFNEHHNLRRSQDLIYRRKLSQ